MAYKVIVVGVSKGGLAALTVLLSGLPQEFPLPLLIVQHLSATAESELRDILARITALQVRDAIPGQSIKPGHVYLAPPGYHLLLERDASLSLSVDAAVNYAIPSVDVLFESAADAFAAAVVGIILTGANKDGSMGLKRIKNSGGLCIVQDPEDAEVADMPQAALQTTSVDYVLPLSQISEKLKNLVNVE